MKSTIKDFINVLGNPGLEYLLYRLNTEYKITSNEKQLTTDKKIDSIVSDNILPTTSIVCMQYGFASVLNYLPSVPQDVTILPVKTAFLEDMQSPGIVDNVVVDLSDFSFNETTKTWKKIYPSVKSTKMIVDKKTASKRKIDTVAESARARYITPGSGQAITYQEKVKEAIDYVTYDQPDNMHNYPFIAAEAKVTGKSLIEIAKNILTKSSAWMNANVKIEEIRLKGKIDIESANNLNTIENVLKETIIQLRNI